MRLCTHLITHPQTYCYCRFLYCSDLWGEMTGTINNILLEHLQNAPQDADLDENKPQIIAHILDIDIHSKKGQFLCLSSISNYHLLQNPDGCGRMVDPQGNVGYNQHILHNPGKHNIPTSPRNRLMYYITMESSSAPAVLVKTYLSIDSKDTYQDIPLQEVEKPIIRQRKGNTKRE